MRGPRALIGRSDGHLLLLPGAQRPGQRRWRRHPHCPAVFAVPDHPRRRPGHPRHLAAQKRNLRPLLGVTLCSRPCSVRCYCACCVTRWGVEGVRDGYRSLGAADQRHTSRLTRTSRGGVSVISFHFVIVHAVLQQQHQHRRPLCTTGLSVRRSHDCSVSNVGNNYKKIKMSNKYAAGVSISRSLRPCSRPRKPRLRDSGGPRRPQRARTVGSPSNAWAWRAGGPDRSGGYPTTILARVSHGVR